MRPALWIIPPLLGIAAYFAAAAKSSDAPPVLVSGKAQERREAPTRSDVSAALAEFKQAWAARQKQEESEDAALSPAALRDKILALKRAHDALPDDADWDTAQEYVSRLHKAAWELGRQQGGEAAVWIDGIEPDLYFSVMAGWSESDPDGAFKAVLASERLGPCSPVTLMELLQGQSKAGLAQACRDLKWHLFRDLPGDPFGDNSLNIPDGADPVPWIESGAARELAEQGVRIKNLFPLWAAKNPSEALANALDWPHSSDAELVDVLGVGLKDARKYDEIRSSLEALPPGQFAKVSAALSRYRKRKSQFGEDLAARYSMLKPADDAAPPP